MAPRRPVTGRQKDILFLPFVLNELRAQCLGVSIHERTELYEDGQPDVVGSDDQRKVSVVGFQYSRDESITLRGDLEDLLFRLPTEKIIKSSQKLLPSHNTGLMSRRFEISSLRLFSTDNTEILLYIFFSCSSPACTFHLAGLP